MTFNIRNIGFILLYISIWLSLDSSIYNFLNIKKGNFFQLLIGLRFIFPFLLFLILIFLFKKDFFLIKLNKQFKYVIYLIFFSFSLQAITPFFNDNDIFNVPFALTSIILLLNLIYFYQYFDLKKIILIGFLILFVINMLYGSTLIDYLIFRSNNLNLYGGWPQNLEALQLLSDNVPRSSGISRSSLILMIPISMYILVNEKLNYKIYIFFLFFSFLMLATQSRISLFGYFLGLIVLTYYIFFTFKENKLKEKLKNILIIIILPIFTWVFTLEILSIIKEKPAYIEFFSDKLSERLGNTEVDEEKYIQLIRKQENFSSNRFQDWENIINTNQNYLIGNGALGDRHLINQSASSLYLYNYASGGILSVFIFLLLILRSIFLCYTFIFKIHTVPDKNNYLVLSSSFIILFLLVRSIVESSFAVFGIDSLIFFSSYFYLEQSYNKINN